MLVESMCNERSCIEFRTCPRALNSKNKKEIEDKKLIHNLGIVSFRLPCYTSFEEKFENYIF